MCNELKPCPFCGGENIDKSYSFGYRRGDKSLPVRGVGCLDCGANTEGKITERAAIEAWNTREGLDD